MKNLFLFFLLSTNFVKGQNLVLNPNMEDTAACATTSNWYSPEISVGWFSSSGSPDAFSTYQNGFCSSPINNLGYGFQLPRSGKILMGLSLFSNNLTNNREYIGGTLIDTLKLGHSYCVSFFASIANNCNVITDALDIYFSADSVFNSVGGYPVLPLIPQAKNITGNIVSDTLNWVAINTSFIAQGGEKYFCIGNFNDDSNTTIAYQPFGNYQEAYYFIDDVSVVDCTVGINDLQRNLNDVIFYPNPTNGKLYIKGNIQLNETRFEIYDLAGKVLKAESMEGKKYIDVQDFANGQYFVALINSSSIIREKISIVK